MKHRFTGSGDFFSTWDSCSHTVSYDKRPRESWQALPLGTGQTGMMAWASDLLDMQVTRSDTWAPDGSLPSLLRVSVKDMVASRDMDASRDLDPRSFNARLDISRGMLTFEHHYADGLLRFIVHAHRAEDAFDLIIEDLRSECTPLAVVPRIWRQSVQPGVAHGMVFHTEYNYYSAFDSLNSRCGLPVLKADALQGLAYGSVVAVQGCEPVGPLCAAFHLPAQRKHRIVVATRCCNDPKLLHGLLHTSAETVLASPPEVLECADGKFWETFNDRSYIELAEGSKYWMLEASWRMNRYIAACSMEGSFVPKFNGSLFLHDHDRRYWGGAYWIQNTRLMYWPLLKSGDSSYARTLFEMYVAAARASMARVCATYGHEGLVFPETMHFWGAARYDDANGGSISNDYIKNHFEGSLEIVHLMLTWIAYNQTMVDDAFKNQVLSFGSQVVRFFLEHFPVRNSVLSLEHSAALETWWDADDPADQIAALHCVAPQLAVLAQELDVMVPDAVSRMLEVLPPLPRGLMDCHEMQMRGVVEGSLFVPARVFHHSRKENYEDPELYALWPYDLLGMGLPEYADVLATFHGRIHQQPLYGWSQTAIWAARLGLAREAADLASAQFTYSAVYPGGMFSSPGYTLWEAPGVGDCPYFDAPGALAIALQEMLVQDHPVPGQAEVRLLPAWPEDEPVRFRLHTRFGIVQHEYKV